MTLKRLLLVLLSVFVLFQVGLSLFSSWNTPQVTDRLQIYQTDLLLHATELEDNGSVDGTRSAVLGKEPLETAKKNYIEVRESAVAELDRLQSQVNALRLPPSPLESQSPTTVPNSSSLQSLQTAIAQQQRLINQLDIKIGLLQATQGKPDEAIATWSTLLESAQTDTTTAEPMLVHTAEALIGLWNTPPRILPDAEAELQNQLEGWFRYTALTKLYTLQQRTDALRPLQQAEQAIAQQTFLKLALIGSLPFVGFIIGVVLLVGLIIQRFTKGEQSLLAQNRTKAWSVPWDWEIILQVLVLGFFFVGQLVLPILIQAIGAAGLGFNAFGSRAQAFSVMLPYVGIAAINLLILYLSVKPFMPLPEGWFRWQGERNWFLWGLGGYFVALPLMIVVSLINQQIWQQGGGSNPLLQIVLEERDPIALGIFFFTASIAAPIFEELLFRGFLLPSLTRYVSVTGAIVLSSLIFATAHLSLSEVLPLTMLGIVLGTVYTRSRGLFSSMLLHSLWNSITMLGLFLLGSGAK